MKSRARSRKPKARSASRWVFLMAVSALFVARDAPARTLRALALAPVDVPLEASGRGPRVAAWAAELPAVHVISANTNASASIRLYDGSGDVDDAARAELERVSARDGEPHRLSARVVQLLFKAAYHFGGAPVVVVSAWRKHAGKHTAGEAIDFKLRGVSPGEVAAYLRGLSRIGVGIYTHPGTQFVHVDEREQSYHWVDGSAPGARARERAIGDRGMAKRDAAYASEMDLPL